PKLRTHEALKVGSFGAKRCASCMALDCICLWLRSFHTILLYHQRGHNSCYSTRFPDCFRCSHRESCFHMFHLSMNGFSYLRPFCMRFLNFVEFDYFFVGMLSCSESEVLQRV